MFRAGQGKVGEYYIVRNGTPQSFGNLEKSLKLHLSKVRGYNLDVEWIRTFNRFFQRRFGFGDVSATPEDIDKACREQDWVWLKRAVPKAIPTSEVSYDRLLQIHTHVEQKLAAILECDHNWKIDDCPREVLEECSRCLKISPLMYRCAFLEKEEHEEDEESWVEGCGVKNVCLECLGDYDDEESRKEDERVHLKSLVGERRKGLTNYTLVYLPSSNNGPFVITRAKSIPPQEKLEYMTSELHGLGKTVDDLPEFAKSYPYMFSDLYHGVNRQKWRIYTNSNDV